MVSELKMGGGLRRIHGQLILGLFFILFFTFFWDCIPGILLSILVVYLCPLLHSLFATTTFFSTVLDIYYHDSTATYIPRLHMYYYL